jgi:endonuclease-3
VELRRWVIPVLPENAAAFDEGVMQLSFAFDDDPILARIRRLLLTAYGAQRDSDRIDPTSLFVYAMISGRTYDGVSSTAFVKLCYLLASWDELPDADVDAVARAIADVQYAARKAEHLISAARIIRARRGRFDLSFLAGWSFEEAYAWLTSLPGAGPKVAAATLNFSELRKPGLVIDTHFLRAAKRIGVLPENADYALGFEGLTRLVPNDWDANDFYEMHWLMKNLGQSLCTFRRPACERCPLCELCAYAQRLTLH